MGGICGCHDDDAAGGEGSASGERSFRFPMCGSGQNSSHSGGVGLSLDNVLDFGCLGSRGSVRPSVIKTIGGHSDEGTTEGGACDSGRSCNDDATGGDGCGVIFGKGGTSHGRGMRLSKEGAVHLIGGNGTLSVC